MVTPLGLQMLTRHSKTTMHNAHPNYSYVRRRIRNYRPELILACGNTAHKAVTSIDAAAYAPVLYMPHPTWRLLGNYGLKIIRREIENILDSPKD
jgi:aspartate/glutamate racemase